MTEKRTQAISHDGGRSRKRPRSDLIQRPKMPQQLRVSLQLNRLVEGADEAVSTAPVEAAVVAQIVDVEQVEVGEADWPTARWLRLLPRARMHQLQMLRGGTMRPVQMESRVARQSQTARLSNLLGKTSPRGKQYPHQQWKSQKPLQNPVRSLMVLGAGPACSTSLLLRPLLQKHLVQHLAMNLHLSR